MYTLKWYDKINLDELNYCIYLERALLSFGFFRSKRSLEEDDVEDEERRRCLLIVLHRTALIVLDDLRLVGSSATNIVFTRNSIINFKSVI